MPELLSDADVGIQLSDEDVGIKKEPKSGNQLKGPLLRATGRIIQGASEAMTPPRVANLPPDIGGFENTDTDMPQPVSFKSMQIDLPQQVEDARTMARAAHLGSHPVTVPEMREYQMHQVGQLMEDIGKREAEPTSLGGKVLAAASGLVPFVAAGPAAPLAMGLEAHARTLSATYEQAKAQGMSDEQASALAVDKAARAGVTEAAIWTILPGPVKSLISKATGKIGQGTVKQFLRNRVVQGGTIGTVSGASQAGQNIIGGRPVGEGVGAAFLGGALIGGLTPGERKAQLPPELAGAERILPRAAQAAKEARQQAVEEAAQPKEENAEGIRKDTGQPGTSGEISEGGEADRGSDLQQAASEPPEPVGARAQEQAQSPPAAPQAAQPEAPVTRYPNTIAGKEQATKDAVSLKPGEDAPVTFKMVQPGASHMGWYEPTKAFINPGDGGVYYPNERGTVTLSTRQIRDSGLKIPQAELDKFKAAGGTEKKGGEPNAKEKEGQEVLNKPAAEQAAGIVDQPVNNPQHVSMGGMAPSDPLETAAQPGGNPDVTGVAERVREQMAKAGQEEQPPPGQGISAADSVERGRTLLSGGADPEAVMSAFEKTGKLSADDMAVARAHSEVLAKEARRIEEEHGTDSEEWRAAYRRRSDWAKRTKAMQTEWHRLGQAQQGEVDIDTGTFTGMQSAYEDSTGKEFTPKQAKVAKQKAAKVKAAESEATKATKAIASEIDKIPTPAENPDAKAASDAEGELHQAEERKAKADRAVADAEARARKAAEKAVATAASKAAKKEKADAVARAKLELEKSKQEQRDAARKLAESQKRARDAAAKAAAAERKQNALSTSQKLWRAARIYIESGANSPDEVVDKLATDTGMSREKVIKELGRNKRAKFLADEAWRKQSLARDVRNIAKRWLKGQEMPGWERAISSVPRTLFSLKVGFHGTVALGTHAPMVAFQPKFWGDYIRDFGKMYKMVGSRAYYEQQVQGLLRRQNYIAARRAGLVNDPFTGEDFNSPVVSQYMGNITGMGNRGYFVLKILRQDMFDQHWNKLPKTAQIPEVAQAIADGVNHATGVTKWSPKGASIALFAPRLEASRVAWLAVDPIRAVRAFANWKNAGEGERRFAINQVKEKAWVFGTYMGLLALNQGMLSATGSDQKINFLNPMASDWMKFKAAGMTFSYGNPIITMARLPVRLWSIRESSGGKLRNLIYPDESSYSVLGEYARSQESPFASLLTDLWMKSDWQNRPLPNSTRPVPRRLRAQGVKPYTWGEFFAEQLLPIPAEEAVREVWQHGLGATPEQRKALAKGFFTLAFMLATGARVADDVPPRK